MDLVVLALRVGLSLAAVLGLLWWLSRRLQSGAGAHRRENLAVLGRQQLTKRSGVAVIEAAGRRLVVGYGDQGVTLVHDAGEAPVPEPAPTDASSADGASDFDADLDRALADGSFDTLIDTSHPTSARKADVRRHRTPLDGSILAPDTWRKAVVAMQDRTSRRS